MKHESLQPELIPLRPEDAPLLRTYLYLALFVPEGEPPVPPEIIEVPELARYIDGWGRPGDQGYLAIDRVWKSPQCAVRAVAHEQRQQQATDRVTVAHYTRRSDVLLS